MIPILYSRKTMPGHHGGVTHTIQLDKLVHDAFIHSDRQDMIKKKTTRGDSFFSSLLSTFIPTLNGTFKVPRLSWMRREVLIGLHKSRRAHREPSVDTVIGEVVRQVTFQEFVYFRTKS